LPVGFLFLEVNRTVDPRAFALHKAWLSSLPTREPIKKQRAVAQLVQDEMPQFLSRTL
jgi:hypothetical protein